MKKLLFLLALLPALVFAQKPTAKHVVWIGVDGLGAYAFDSYYNVQMPNLRNLMKEGAWTTHGNAVYPTISAPNWKAMFCSCTPDMHGFLDNDREPQIEPKFTSPHGYTDIFHVVRQAKPDAKIYAQVEWGDIDRYCDTLCLTRLTKVEDVDVTVETPRQAAALIKSEKPDFLFIHIDQADHTGHSIGHRTPEYFRTVEDIDRQIGLIIQAIKDAGIFNETDIVITADHGGQGSGHGGKTEGEIKIPAIFAGPGIKKNFEITDVYMQFDVAPTIAHMFGITQMPQCWIGRCANIFK